MSKEQTKADAVQVIIWDARRETSSVASYKKVLRALQTLGLEGDELNRVLHTLDYHDHNGQPYKWLLK